MHDPAVKFILGACFCLLLFVIFPAQGLRCYHCTNDDPGCPTLDETSTVYEKDCPGAIRCILFKIVYRSYVFPKMFFRTCLYEVDRHCYTERSMELRTNMGYTFYFSLLRTYPRILACLKKSRSEANLPAPLETKTELPADVPAELGYHVFDTNLGNSWNWTYFSGFGEWDRIPSVLNLSCYSCAAEIPGYAFDQFKPNAQDSLVPHCTDKDNDNMPVIQCNGAYGCAAFWELRNEIEDGEIKTISRVWRDCWYPGDHKCLRFPYSYPEQPPRLGWGRSLIEKTSCGTAFEESRGKGRSDGVYQYPAWADVHQIQTWTKYNDYVQCAQNIREELGIDSENFKLVKEESDKKDGNPFARIIFYFCGTMDNCNSGRPLPPPPPPPPTTTTATTTTTTTTTTTASPTKPFDGIRTGIDTYDPKLPEPYQLNCFLIDKRNGASSQNGISKVTLLLVSIISTLIQELAGITITY